MATPLINLFEGMVFGEKTLFKLETVSRDGVITVTLSCVPPIVKYDRETDILAVFSPRTETVNRLLEL